MENGVANCCLREAFESVCDEQELNVVIFWNVVILKDILKR